MLIDSDRLKQPDPILSILAGGREAIRLQVGVYEIHHFGSSHWPQGFEHFPRGLSVGPYGVADSVEQILEKCPEIQAPGRDFLVTVTPVLKSDQPPEGGWRWHKWGQYIGDHEPQCEYLYDEPEIDKVLVFHIYEKD